MLCVLMQGVWGRNPARSSTKPVLLTQRARTRSAPLYSPHTTPHARAPPSDNPIILPSDFTHQYLWGPEQYSYTRMWAPNATVLHLEQVKVFPTPGVWASIDIVQPKHGPFPATL